MTKTTNDVFEFYEDKIAPAYAYLVAVTGEKPIQVLVEIENAFAHLSKSIKGVNPQENINKAFSHLVRLYIDLYKLLAVELKVMAENRNILLDINFIKYTKEAREFELNNIGNSEETLEVGKKYSKAINIALDSLGLDPIKP